MEDERLDWYYRTLERWNAGERRVREEELDHIHPEFELHTRMLGRIVYGAEGIQTWFDEIGEQFDAWQLTVDEVERLPNADGYLLLGSVRLHGRGSGLEMDQDLAWRIEFEGDQMRLMKTYTNPDEATAEAGADLRTGGNG